MIGLVAVPPLLNRGSVGGRPQAHLGGAVGSEALGEEGRAARGRGLVVVSLGLGLGLACARGPVVGGGDLGVELGEVAGWVGRLLLGGVVLAGGGETRV
jgi:hypothetical protein